jgi:hypothetical protein
MLEPGPDSLPWIWQVNDALQRQLAVLPTGETAKEAVKKGFAVVVGGHHL